ncbi:ParB-like chromosome segregation protein Spo0J [Bradyrhizobium sp. LA6.1]
MIMSAKSVEIIPASGTEVLIPLNKLKKSPNNARRTPHSGAAIEGYAASIAAKGILQNLVVEPELDGEGTATGFYLVTIGEGRRLAQLLRVKRKEIKKTEAIRCIIDTANDPHEISLDENVTRENMHPADQFEAFRKFAEGRGFGAEEIAARFGVTPHVVRQRLQLGAVSPKLMQLYRDGDLTLEQLMAFAITDDQARQEGVYERLSYDRDASTIRRLLTETHVAATDRRARFVGLEAYIEAGGTVLRDLFTEDRGGYLEDLALLDLLVTARLGREADALRAAEGWKWTEPHLDFPHAHCMRRAYPHPVELSAQDQTALQLAQSEFDRLNGHLWLGLSPTSDEGDSLLMTLRPMAAVPHPKPSHASFFPRRQAGSSRPLRCKKGASSGAPLRFAPRVRLRAGRHDGLAIAGHRRLAATKETDHDRDRIRHPHNSRRLQGPAQIPAYLRRHRHRAQSR